MHFFHQCRLVSVHWGHISECKLTTDAFLAAVGQLIGSNDHSYNLCKETLGRTILDAFSFVLNFWADDCWCFCLCFFVANFSSFHHIWREFEEIVMESYFGFKENNQKLSWKSRSVTTYCQRTKPRVFEIRKLVPVFLFRSSEATSLLAFVVPYVLKNTQWFTALHFYITNLPKQNKKNIWLT